MMLSFIDSFRILAVLTLMVIPLLLLLKKRHTDGRAAAGGRSGRLSRK